MAASKSVLLISKDIISGFLKEWQKEGGCRPSPKSPPPCFNHYSMYTLWLKKASLIQEKLPGVAGTETLLSSRAQFEYYELKY